MALFNPSKFWLSRLPRFSKNCRNVCNGHKKVSEENENKTEKTTIPFEGPTDIRLINGIPEEQLKSRLVKIFKPNKNPMQSGTGNLGHWEIAFDNRQRWENPNMGWCSTGDPLSNMKLKFSTKEEAIEFCERNGWKWYFMKASTKRKFKVKSYGNNFADRRSRVSTK